MDELLKETELLDFSNPQIQELINSRSWRQLAEKDRILAVYNFIRDEIAFGYNLGDYIPASKVLKDGYGQCNTKGILFMALLRTVGIPCRIHGFFVDKTVQKGAMTGFYYKQASRDILHSWVEIYYVGKWLNLEGFILDIKYLGKLQDKFSNCEGSFCSYGVAVPDFKNPPIEWNETDTYIQKDSITSDLGIYDSPDELFTVHRQKIGWFKNFMFKHFVRHSMNRNIRRIRNHK